MYVTLVQTKVPEGQLMLTLELPSGVFSKHRHRAWPQVYADRHCAHLALNTGWIQDALALRRAIS
jgi:hypothetical protein